MQEGQRSGAVPAVRSPGRARAARRVVPPSGRRGFRAAGGRTVERPAGPGRTSG
ncbi:hypothetical protein PV779_42985 [Streptomyces sp. ID01-9D]|nr:hypothetical protein [Streptomyces sp. ID01-9D]